MRTRATITALALAIGLIAAAPAASAVDPVRVDALRLGCRLASADEQRAIVCVWSHIEAREVAGYRLFRSVDGGERAVIFRTGPDGPQRFADFDIRPGHRFRYAVAAYNADGRVLAVSRVAHVGIPPG